MALTLTAQLDAVNQMLESIWESPVSSLDVAGVASVAQAKRVLDQTTISVQSRGWSFNTISEFILTPDVNGKIPLPANTLRVDADGVDVARDVVQRGAYLYDKDDNTLTFTKPISVTLVSLLEWDDLPQAVRMYITVYAARVFKDRWLQKDTPTQPSAEEVEALRNLEDFEAGTGDYNVMTGSWSVANILRR